MAKFHISKDQNGEFQADKADITWILDKGVTITSDTDFGFSSNWDNTTVIVKGAIEHSEAAGSAVKLGSLSKAIVDGSGRIEGAGMGVMLSGHDSLLVNRGLVEGSTGAFFQAMDATVRNSGKLIGTDGEGIRFTGANGEVINQQGGLVKGDVGIEVDLAPFGVTRIVNHGTIRGENWAISGSD